MAATEEHVLTHSPARVRHRSCHFHARCHHSSRSGTRVPVSSVVFQPSVHVLWGCQPVEHVMLSYPSPFPHWSSRAFLSTSVTHVKSHGKNMNSAGSTVSYWLIWSFLRVRTLDDVEDSTGLTGTEVDLEGYAEASEGHLPQGKPQFQFLIILKPSREPLSYFI
uniref:Uncharacterized protein n=1 Tax=Oryza barthii TaxID=65489 RepID=A0A0D3H424_9ORYZ